MSLVKLKDKNGSRIHYVNPAQIIRMHDVSQQETAILSVDGTIINVMGNIDAIAEKLSPMSAE